jgi:sorbitol-specific phosphotransferase system component IIBC
MDEEKIHEAQFMQLVMSMQSSAWMMMGKTINPMTGTIEKNLEVARSIIDTLLMLKAKTKGNLSKTEDAFLSNAIQQLQINFVEEMKNSEKEKSKEEQKQDAVEQNKKELKNSEESSQQQIQNK